MHPALLLVLSSLGAQAVPLLNLRTNSTMQRREEPYSVVNVGDQPSTDGPSVQTVVVPNPPQAPTTITVTSSPSATPSPCSTSVPGGYPAWPAGPLSTGNSAGESNLVARGYNSTLRAARNLRRSFAVNGTETHDLLPRHNGSEPYIKARTDENVDAGNNGTASGLGARHNLVASRLTARNNGTIAERAVAFTRGLVNVTDVQGANVMARGLNGTSLRT
ncbi:hypothetical protein BDV59DRAFT_169411 [Aspergillus ambiguus]|uniref:uncharacterized protein n=1 Tax=Aspergillus ambiguus TaxID=176160 RepID=UPI003CCD1E65